MAHLNIPPGPLVGKILNQLFEEVVDNKKANNQKSLLKRAEEISRKLTSQIV